MWVLLFAMLMTGLLQVFGVSSILPLISVISDPRNVDRMGIVSEILDVLGATDIESAMVWLTMLAFAALVVSNILSAITSWFSFRFVWSVQSRLSTDVLARYMEHPYEHLLQRNPSEAEKNILSEVHVFTNGVMLPLLRFLSSGTVVVIIGIFLVVYNPLFALMATAVLGLGYLLTFSVLRRRIANAGERRVVANQARFQKASEAIAATKEAQILGRTSEFVSRYSVPAQRFATVTSLQQILAETPRYAIEVLAFGSVLLISMFVAYTSDDVSEIGAIAGIYAVAGYRLMPNMQRMYNAWSQIRFNRVVVKILFDDHQYGVAGTETYEQESKKIDALSGSIEIRDLKYRYPAAEEDVIDGINIDIGRGQTVCFVGETGSGKTTLAELILGMLPASSGGIFIDGTELSTTNARSWQDQIGYVPQDVYLIDDSIEANIAFGIPAGERDIARIRDAAQIARIDNFVETQLPYGYKTVIGDRGVRLSGGQRQRLGIARALYHEPSVLLLDEATSNLDRETEESLQQAIEAISGDLTVLVVAHRLLATRSSDMIYVLDNGRIINKGKYNDVVDESGGLRTVI